MNTITVKASYGKHLQGTSKKTGKPYNMVELSDGYAPVLFTTQISSDLNDRFSKKDEVEVTLEVNPFDKYNTFLLVEIN